MQRRVLILGLAGCGGVLWGCGKSPLPAGPAQAPQSATPILPGWQPVELLKAAKRSGRGVSADTGTYFWRSEEEALFVRAAGAAGEFRTSTLSVASGKEEPLTVLNQRIRGRLRGTRVRMASPSQPEGEIRYLPPMVTLSPDGRWLLWYGGLQWTALSLESLEEQQWRQPSPLQNPAVWLRDSQHWAELEADAREGRDYFRRVLLHDLQNPQADRTVETPILEAGDVLGFTPEGRLLIRHPAPVATAEVATFTEVTLSSEQGILRTYPVLLSHLGQVLETALSPNGDLLAWVVTPLQGKQDERTLWISRPDGTGMTHVGSTRSAVAPERKTADPQKNPGLHLARWLPSGKQISFVAGDSLYILRLGE